MIKTVALFKKTLVFALCFTIVFVSALGVSLRTQAAASLVVSATVNGTSVNVSVAFPDISFAASTVEVSFNPAHLELSAKATTAGLTHGMISISEAANANAAGKCTFAIMNFTGNLSAKGGTLNLVFTIKDATVETTPLTVTVVNCGDTSANPIELGGTSATLTLKTVTPPPPPPSSDSEGSGSSEVVTDTPDSDDSDTPVSSGNSNSSGTSDTPNSGSSEKPVSSNKTSSKVPSDSQTSDTGTVTDSAEASDTESIVSSSESDVATDLPLTDTTILPPSQNSDANPPASSTVSLGGQTPRPTPQDEGIDTDTVILLVSIAVACCLCFCLTYLGLRRQAPKNPEEE